MQLNPSFFPCHSLLALDHPYPISRLFLELLLFSPLPFLTCYITRSLDKISDRIVFLFLSVKCCIQLYTNPVNLHTCQALVHNVLFFSCSTWITCNDSWSFCQSGVHCILSYRRNAELKLGIFADSKKMKVPFLTNFVNAKLAHCCSVKRALLLQKVISNQMLIFQPMRKKPYS